MNDVDGSANAGNPTDWVDAITDADLKGYVQTKGFRDPGALADSYRNLEKLVGVPKERLLKLPEKADDPEWGGIWGRLGKPEKPEEYQLQGDEALTQRFGGVFHEANLTRDQASKINGAWNAYVAELLEKDEAEFKARDDREIGELKTKWGANFDQHAEFGRRAGQEFGLSEDDFKAVSDALGPGRTLELFHRIGSKLGEAKPFTGDGQQNFGQMTKEQAQHRIAQLQKDSDWTSRYLNGGAKERAEMEALAKAASS